MICKTCTKESSATGCKTCTEDVMVQLKRLLEECREDRLRKVKARIAFHDRFCAGRERRWAI